MIYALITLSLLSPLFVILAYRQGIKDGKAILHDEPLSPLKVALPIPKTSVKDERYSQILSNIDNYTGDATGQKKVNK